MKKNVFIILWVLIVARAFMYVTGHSAAQETAVQPTTPPPVGDISLVSYFSDGAKEVAVQGNLAYVGRSFNFAILDIANSQPTLLGELFLNGYIEIIRLNGSFAHVVTAIHEENAIRHHTLYVIDISNPANPSVLAATEHGQIVHDIAIAGQYMYLTDSDFRIWDISQPTSPIEVALIDLESPDDVEVEGNYVYLIHSDGLSIFDITNPAHPAMLGTYGSRKGLLKIAGTRAYIGSTLCIPPLPCESRLQIVDISNPASPTELSVLSVGTDTQPLAVSGYHVYLGSGPVQVINVANPTLPVLVTTIPTSAAELQITGNTLYSGGQGFRIWDITTPALPVEVGSYHNDLGIRELGDYSIVDNLVYLVGNDGLIIWDVSNGAVPEIIGRYDLTDFQDLQMIIRDEYAYLVYIRSSNLSPHLAVVDISDPENPVEVGHNTVAGSADTDFILEGNYLYALGSSGTGHFSLWTVDISNPASPDTTDYLVSSGYHPTTIKSDNNRLYIQTIPHQCGTPCGSYSLQVAEFSDPAHPAISAVYTPPNDHLNVIEVRDDLVYAITQDSESNFVLQVLDFSDASNPVVVGSTMLGEQEGNVKMAGNLVYVYLPDGTLSIIDLSNPAEPEEISNFSTQTTYYYLQVVDDYVYLSLNNSDHLDEIEIINVKNPAAPYLAGLYNGGGRTGNIIVSDDYLYGISYSSDGISDGVEVFQFTPPGPWVVSGFVGQANGRPFNSAIITNSLGENTTSGSNGLYTFSTTYSGTITLTPTLANHTFWPPVRTATTPPNATGQNFTILPLPVTATLTADLPYTLTYTDTQGLPTQFVIPGESISQTTVLTVTPGLATPPGNWAFTGHAFEITAVPNLNLSGSTPIQVGIEYSEADIRAATDENELALFWWDGSEWVDSSLVCGPGQQPETGAGENSFQGAICENGRYALFVPTHALYLPVVTRN